MHSPGDFTIGQIPTPFFSDSWPPLRQRSPSLLCWHLAPTYRGFADHDSKFHKLLSTGSPISRWTKTPTAPWSSTSVSQMDGPDPFGISRLSMLRVSHLSNPRLLITKINGPDLILIQRLWLLREIAYRDFGVLDALCLWHIKVPIADASADVTHDLARVRFYHVSLWFVTHMCLNYLN